MSLQDKSNKIFENDNMLIYNDNVLGKVVEIDNIPIVCECDIHNHSEMMAHIPLCIHPSTSSVLLIGNNGVLLQEILKHKSIQQIDVVDNHELVDVYTNYFDCKDVYTNTKIKLHKQDGLDYIRDTQNNMYDVIIINSTSYISNQDTYLAHTKRVLKENGVLIAKSKNLMLNTDVIKSTIATLGKDFRIAMPCRFDMQSCEGHSIACVVASNKYHPTADLILHKSDLLDDLHYYNSDLHKYSFVLPNNIINYLKDVAKN